jgi:pyroglutamyl-peptidase
LVLVTGFGPFEAFERNPSGALAEELGAAPPPGLRTRTAVLPVSFARAPQAFDALLGPLLARGEPPALLLGLGVARRAGFRLERYGGPRLKCVPRPDVDGRTAAEYHAEGPRLATELDVRALAARLCERGVDDVRVSHTAGGYVCERLYHHLLGRAAELSRPGLFVHVPPERFAPLARQRQVLDWLLEELRASLAP